MTGKESTIRDYHKRINKVLVYVNEHMDEKMELEKLACISSFSTFHFHRIMRAYLNESLGSFLLRLRLDKAAGLLEYTSLSPSEVAWKVGYEVPSSFNKAFKKRFGLSPGEYRNGQRLKFQTSELIIQNTNNMDIKPKIKELKPCKVIYVTARGAYNESAKEAWDKICSFAGKNKLFGFSTEMIGISHDDPNITESDKLRYDACIRIKKEIDPAGEVGVKEIAGGRYAIFKHKGPYEKLSDTYNAIYRVWLPGSGESLRDAPCFEKYLNNPDKTKPEQLLTEIHLPIE